MTDNEPQIEMKQGLVRQLGLFDSTMIIVGIVIGSGIFLTTGIMAKSIPSTGLILLAWIAGGLLTFAGAVTYAELGASLPEAGGQYVYLKKAYGPLPGFLFGWISFLVYIPGSIAALAIAFSEYLSCFFPQFSTDNMIFSADFDLFNKTIEYSVSMGQIIAVGLIAALSTMNYLGVNYGKLIQNFFTLLKIGAITAIIAFGFSVGKGRAVPVSLNPMGWNFSQILLGFGVAIVAVTWAFDGWNYISFVAGEIKNPKRNIPLSLFSGISILTVLYVLMNYIYMYALPIGEIQGEVRIAEKAALALFGGDATALVAAAVMISAFGALNGTILAGPRIYYAMAKDRLFFRRVAVVHPRFHTPGFAIIIQAAWAFFLTLSGKYEQLFTFVMFVAIIIWISAVLSVFTLRKKYPQLPRPYKTWGYPVVPAIFIVASFGILINTLIEKPLESLVGLALTGLGIPAYFLWKK